MFRRLGIVMLLAAMLLQQGWVVAGHVNADEGTQALSFRLPDHRGREWSMDDFESSQMVAIVFLGTECPLAQLYAVRLTELHRQYADQGVSIVGVVSNTQDSLTEIGDWVERHQLPFPVLKDPGNRLADQLQAERTPEVFLFDLQRELRYRGRIDDQYSVGRARATVQRRDLVEAMEELLAGREVSVARTQAPGCIIGRVQQAEPTGEITWSTHIAEIFHSRCFECHREGEIAPFELRTFEDVVGWQDTILEVIEDNRMPPWFANPDHGHFKNDARLSSDQKDLLRTWVRNGMPAGDRSQEPMPPQFTAGWRIPEPDQVIAMSEEPFTVPAEGVVDYKYFDVDPGWTEDKYVWAAEARPDQRGVVHHIIAYVIPPGADGEDDKPEGRKMLVGYAPGATANILTDGIAMHVPAGSTLKFEMHYTPNGTEVKDRSYIGLKFLDRDEVRKQLHGGAVLESDFTIPPHAPDAEVTKELTLKHDVLLLDMTPHMHLRGKSFRYEAMFPDGTRETLLDVPNYDFNWQLSYELAEPRLLPKGTTLRCTAVYDNSAANLANPNPDQPVKWGDQSDEEMMIGFFTMVPPDKPVSTTKK